MYYNEQHGHSPFYPIINDCFFKVFVMKSWFFVVFIGIVLFGGLVFGGEDLNGVSGKIFNVDLSGKSFELLKETVFDPKTNEGKSRHRVYWTENTQFAKVITQKHFGGVVGPVVTVFDGFRGNDAKAAAAGKAFSAKTAIVLPQAKKADGFSKSGSQLSAWFTPDKKKNTRTGAVKINGKDVKFTLLNWPKAKAVIRTTTNEKEISVGFWDTTVHGKYVGERFVLDSVEVRPLVDPRTVDDASLPRVLVIGDSISMNYHEAAKTALKGKANYYRCEGNGGPSDRGAASAELWLGDYTTKGLGWDVIQFNHGLHDLKQAYDKEKDSWGTHQVSIEDYKKNLEKEIGILKKTGAKLIWCSTTPVPQNSTGKYARRKGEAAVFNKAAMDVISKYPEIGVSDLHKFISESKEFDKWRKGTDVHFWGKDLQEMVGEAVAKEISKALEELGRPDTKDVKAKKVAARGPKVLWADSCIWAKAPKIEVEKWLGDKPDTKGKYVLVEVWATWCSQCVRSIPHLNKWHEKYPDELVVVGISNESEEKVKKFKGPKIKYYSGVDTKGRVKDALGVRGFPHIIIIEPGGYVVWEGFPYLKGYELTDDIVEKILAVGRKEKANSN